MSQFELAPTADVPRSRDPEPVTYYKPCEACGRQVLWATTVEGELFVVVMLDTDQTRQKTYCVDFGQGRKHPIAKESMAYPVHRCRS